jgi:fatty-acyl-CoA synthase
MLERNSANYAPLTPVAFLRRSAEVYPAKTAVIHGDRTFTYREFEERCRRLASALRKKGIGRGDTVAIMAPNVPALLEAHYAVPGIGAILNALNYRLDAATIAFCLEHGEAKILITDREFSAIVGAALRSSDARSSSSTSTIRSRLGARRSDRSSTRRSWRKATRRSLSRDPRMSGTR